MITVGEHALPSVVPLLTSFLPMIRIAVSFLITIAVVVLAILSAIGRIADTPRDTAHRLRSAGLSQAAIAAALGISRYRVRKLLA